MEQSNYGSINRLLANPLLYNQSQTILNLGSFLVATKQGIENQMNMSSNNTLR